MLNRCGHWGVNTCVRTCSLSWVELSCSDDVQLCYYYYFRHFDFTLKSGTFGVTGRSCQDAGQHGTNLGHPGKSGTGGNPTSSSVYSIDSVARANYRQLILATLYVYLCRDKLRSWQHISIHIHNSHQIRTRNFKLELDHDHNRLGDVR